MTVRFTKCGSATAANLIGLDDVLYQYGNGNLNLQTFEAGNIVENTTTGDFYVYKGDNLSANTDTTSASTRFGLRSYQPLRSIMI